ncbi:hypothetical protein AGDE_17002 [Angomonas deanei]|uniref:Uncharacterized protein n=1 Tax=Angomonas deanei TaxID=59799 RepID=A0A7G2C398_9TRYP|nr:hypothetical protein AGDE_17002 [Angomonas deanei]CAD2213611.1 hypothetical protein, conserved [Angomonas deanei]|eukprot:EPY15714.1 hypothetical protein AGDE_17002 [Angomonas deanei]
MTTNTKETKKTEMNDGSKSPQKKTDATNTVTEVRNISKKFDNNIHTIVVNNSKSRKVSVQGQKVDVSGTKYTVTETHSNPNPFVLSQSDYLTHLTEQAHCSHVCCLISLCGNNNKTNVSFTESVAIEMTTNIMKRLEAAKRKDKENFFVTLTGAAFPTSNRTQDKVMVKDVLGDAKPIPAKFAANPVTTTSVANVKEESVKSSEDPQKLIKKCVKGFDKKDDEMLVIQMHVTQVRKPKDVYLSSFMFVFVNHLQKTFILGDLLENIKKKRREGVLFTSAIGGSCATALLIPISDDDVKNEADVQYLNVTVKEGEKLNQMKNKPLRSGSVAKFIQNSESPIKKGVLKDEKVVKRISLMTGAAAKVIEAPEKASTLRIPLNE